MSQPAISIDGVSKKYVIEHESRHDSLRDTLHHIARKFWRRARWGTGFGREEFWALRDISFEIQPGEVVGIIGRNGAGKSTLLKVLSRITEPTSGKITLNGRVASLLEVGTGFHPDLTGRENIFLNGAILGMSRVEIRRKFDEIVAFAEIERFLDTPVKRYSSGMYVRLAFAVAAHLEPEILIVDEVLAVGDQQFQDKCLGKLRSVAHSGRTVMFVSHNLTVTQSLCSRVLLMANGQIDFSGPPGDAITRYLKSANHVQAVEFYGKDPALRLEKFEYSEKADKPGLDLIVTIRNTQARRVALEFILTTMDGRPAALADCGTLDYSQRLDLQVGDTRLTCRIDTAALANGGYLVSTQLVDPYAHILLRYDHPIPITLARGPRPGASRALELAWNSGVIELPLLTGLNPHP